MKGVQKYATKVFYSLDSAIKFKNRLGSLSLRTIKTDKLGRYKVQWKIDKENTVKYSK